MHKELQGVPEIINTWADGRTVLGDGEWTVSMENELDLAESGFLVEGRFGVEPNLGLAPFVEGTPPDLLGMGYVYVPAKIAPLQLLQCVNSAEDDARQQNNSTRIVRQFQNQKTILLVGGLNGSIRFSGVGLTPLGKEKPARVTKILASAPVPNLGLASDVMAMLQPLHDLADQFLPVK